MANDTTQQPLLFNPGRCYECWDSTIVRTPHGLTKCLKCFGEGQPVLPAAKRLAECVWHRVENGKEVDAELLNFARMLVRTSATQPMPGEVLQGQLRESARNIKDMARTLRREWLLPIGTNRSKKPYGYFFITTAKEFLDWSRVFRAQAIDELVTLYRVQRNNFPELAGQEPIEFAEILHDELRDAL